MTRPILKERLQDVSGDRAVIINVNTKEFATLALLSTLRYSGMPVVLVDCSTDDSFEYFRSLPYDFELLKMPLATHGTTLDRIFNEIGSERVLLIDSDLEILNDNIMRFARRHFDDENVFGTGFVNGPAYQEDGSYFHERIWMPFAFLKTAPVREAIREGVSFNAESVPNGYPRALRPAAWRLPWTRRLFAPFRSVVHTQRPVTVFYDTGSRMYDHLRYKKMMNFIGLPLSTHELYTKHFFGMTRTALHADDVTHGDVGATMHYVNVRLRAEYGFSPIEKPPVRPMHDRIDFRAKEKVSEV